MSNVAGALHEVGVLQLAVAVGALQQRPAPAPGPVVAAVAGAGHLVTAGPGGRGASLQWAIGYRLAISAHTSFEESSRARKFYTTFDTDF